MRPIDPLAVRTACEEIRKREAGDERYDTIRKRLAEEIGLDLRTVLEQEHDIRLVRGDDWRRLAALDAALEGEGQP